MLRTCKRPLAGNDVPTKPTPKDTGILDCVALIDGKLPKLADLKMAPRAEPQVN
jgi:hypothetical protein